MNLVPHQRRAAVRQPLTTADRTRWPEAAPAIPPVVTTSERGELLAALHSDYRRTTAGNAGESWAGQYMHKVMERAHGRSARFHGVLELGANDGEHLPFVRHQFDSYLVTDIRAPRLSPALLADPRISADVCDPGRIRYPAASFDRVVVTCLLHHAADPLAVARRIRRITRPGGNITLLVPTDPSLAYRACHALTAARSARAAGQFQRWQLMHAVDHRNHFRSIRRQLWHVFGADDVAVSWLPLRIPLVELNMLTVWQITVRPSGSGGDGQF